MLTITGLPAGTDITYSVEEVEPDGFTFAGTSHEGNVITITNRKTAQNQSLNIPVYVEWFDIDGVTETEAPSGISSLTVYLVRDDEKTGDSIVVVPTSWEGMFENIQKISGSEYTVTVDPQEGYDAAVSAVSSGEVTRGFRIRFTARQSEEERVVSIPVTIEWLDENGNMEMPEDDPTVEVWLLKDGERYDSVVISAMSDWTSVFENVTLTKGSTWFVEEVVPEGYIMVYRVPNTDNKPEDGFTIRNQKQSTETLTIPVSATWSDPQGGSVPEAETTLNVYVTINGERTGQSLVLSKSNNWAGQFASVPVVSGASYGVTIDALSDYTSEISANVSGDPTAGYVIAKTKKWTMAAVDIPVTVVWKDTDGTTALTPAASASVNVFLLKDGGRTGDSLTITAADGWQKTFTGIIPEIGSSYSLELQSVTGFGGAVAPNGSGTLAEGFTATLVKRAGSAAQASGLIAQAGQTITMRISVDWTNPSYQWEYSTDGGYTWQNCTSAGNDTGEFPIEITESSHGRQYRCVVTDGSRTAMSQPRVIILVDSTDPYVGNVLHLPSDLEVIEEEAFAGIDATTVVIPEGTESIGSRAFADCNALRYIVIPDALSNIAEDAFDGSLVIFVCSEGSSAAAYAESHGIPVTNP